MVTNDIIELFIQSTKNEQSFKQLKSELIDYFTNTPVSIIISNLENLIEFLNQLKKKVITFTILYDEELTNIIDNIEEFHLYLKNVYTKQKQDIKQNVYNDIEQEEKITEQLKNMIIYKNILLEQDEQDEQEQEDNNKEEINTEQNDDINQEETNQSEEIDKESIENQEINQQDTIVILPDDTPEEIRNNDNITTSNETKNVIYYELTLMDLLQYNFNLEYIKQFVKDLTNLITIILKLEKQEIKKLHL